jgi:hypothetical protein
VDSTAGRARAGRAVSQRSDASDRSTARPTRPLQEGPVGDLPQLYADACSLPSHVSDKLAANGFIISYEGTQVIE